MEEETNRPAHFATGDALDDIGGGVGANKAVACERSVGVVRCDAHVTRSDESQTIDRDRVVDINLDYSICLKPERSGDFGARRSRGPRLWWSLKIPAKVSGQRIE